MPDHRTQFEAEQRRVAPAQQTPEWLEWLSFEADGLAWFASTVLPEPPDDPWSAEGLRAAERAALALFPGPEVTDLRAHPETATSVDATRRYLGEVFIRAFEGSWRNLPRPGQAIEPVVFVPYSDAYLNVTDLLATALEDRSGEEWAIVHGYQRRAHAAWVAAGRPELPDWLAQQDGADG